MILSEQRIKEEKKLPKKLSSISDYSTKELVNELSKREGVEQMKVAPHKDYLINVDENFEGEKDGCEGTGSAIILIVTD